MRTSPIKPSAASVRRAHGAGIVAGPDLQVSHARLVNRDGIDPNLRGAVRAVGVAATRRAVRWRRRIDARPGRGRPLRADFEGPVAVLAGGPDGRARTSGRHTADRAVRGGGAGDDGSGEEGQGRRRAGHGRNDDDRHVAVHHVRRARHDGRQEHDDQRPGARPVHHGDRQEVGPQPRPDHVRGDQHRAVAQLRTGTGRLPPGGRRRVGRRFGGKPSSSSTDKP